MMRALLSILVAVLILAAPYAAEVSVEGGGEAEVSLPIVEPLPPIDSNNVTVIPGSGIQVLGVDVNNGQAKISAIVYLPTPCYEIEKEIEMKSGTDTDTVYVTFYMESTAEICVQTVKPVHETIEVNVDPRKKTVVYLTRKIEREIKTPKVEVVQPVIYSVEVEGNRIVVNIKGCYTYEIEPLKCPNCYVVYVTKEGNCEQTVVELPYTEGFPPAVKIELKGAYTIEAEVNKEELGAIEKSCEEILREINKNAPELAKEVEILCKEGPFYEVKEKVCDLLEKKNPEAYREVCEFREMAKEMVRERIRKIMSGEINAEEIEEEVKKLKEEIEKFREEIKELKIRVHELKRKIVVTPAGVVVEGEGELNLPKVEVEVKIHEKALVIKKERNEVLLEVNGPVKAKVKVKAPIEVENNVIAIKGAVVKVLPDQVIEKIKQKLKNAEIEEVELEVEENRPVYKIEAKVRGRLLFILPVEVPVKTYVDAETGTEIKIERPWWAFLVFG